jgi:hypothetical protein
MMKVAFLMQCHKNPEQINLLLEALNHPMVDVFVHVDKKSQAIKDKITQRAGVYILPEQQCVDVQWAQYSQVEATLQLLRAAVNRGGYSHYWLISGQDYPLRPMDNILDFLEANQEANFIECSQIKPFNKRNDVYFPNSVIGRKLWQKVLKNLWIYGTGGWNKTFPIFKRKAPDDFKYWFGSQWWCLNSTTAQWIIDYLNEHTEYEKFFEHSLCSDECFFQTLVMNSPFANTTKPYLHYIKWEKGKSSPRTLTTIDYEELKKTEKIIARKFDIDVDTEIIERLRKR